MNRNFNTRTDKRIIADGDFAKIGSQHYRHVSGIEVRYVAAQPGQIGTGWMTTATGESMWQTLEVAVWAVRNRKQ